MGGRHLSSFVVKLVVASLCGRRADEGPTSSCAWDTFYAVLGCLALSPGARQIVISLLLVKSRPLPVQHGLKTHRKV